MKRILTRFVLGGFVFLLVLFISFPFAESALKKYISPPDKKSAEQVFLENSITLYVQNSYFHSGDSLVQPFDELKDYYRPEIKAALSSGAMDKVSRDDHNDAVTTLFLTKFNETQKKEYDEAKKKKKDSAALFQYSREDIIDILSKYKSKGLFYYGIGAGFALLFSLAWIFLHDRVFSIINQYRKGRLYNVLDDEIKNKDQVIEHQKNEITSLETKLNEKVTAFNTKVTEFNALEQKFRTFYNQMKEKEKAENEAAEKAKKKAEEKKALEEEAENAFS